MSYITIRDVTKVECPLLENDIAEDTLLNEFLGSTYGRVAADEFAVCFPDKPLQFFGIPKNAVNQLI